MKTSQYKFYDDLPLFLNTEMVAAVLGIAPSNAYELCIRGFSRAKVSIAEWWGPRESSFGR